MLEHLVDRYDAAFDLEECVDDVGVELAPAFFFYFPDVSSMVHAAL